MSPTGIETALPVTRGQFWPRFVVPAILTPAIWYLLEMLAGPDGVVAFYIVSIGAVPVAAAVVLAPGARLTIAVWRDRRWLIPVVTVLSLPTIAIVLWGAFCTLWLALLFLRGEL